MSLLLNGFWLVNNYLPKLRYIIDGFPYSSFILNSAWFLSVNSTFRGDLLYPRPQIATTNIVLFVKDIENVPIFHVSDSAIVTPHCRYINLQWGLLILKKDHTQEPDSNYVQESLNLPISLKIVVCGISTCNVLINTYCYIHATLPTLTIGRNPYNADTKHYYLIVGK